MFVETCRESPRVSEVTEAPVAAGFSAPVSSIARRVQD